MLTLRTLWNRHCFRSPTCRHISFKLTLKFSIKMSSQTADHAEGAREVDTAGLSKRLESKRDILQARVSFETFGEV